MESGQKQWLTVLLLCLAVVCFGSCARQQGRMPTVLQKQTGIPRIDPGHVQWLEHQSMLASAQDITRQVSGSERLWQNTATRDKTDVLLKAAPNWLIINPYQTSMENGHFFTSLAHSPLLRLLPQIGITGVFLAPTNERDAIWRSHSASSTASFEDNVCALRFDQQLGTDQQFAKLIEVCENLQLQMGGLLVPAATGLGPDFMLQARANPRFEGLYAMIEAPRERWNILPESDDTWECKALNEHQIQTLQELNILPQPLVRETLPWTSSGGWAATGTVRGVDGNTRRWLYRFSEDVSRPILHWQDPSGQARRIYSASAIRHTGMQRQALAGLSMEPLLGLEPGDDSGPLSSGLNAIEQLGLEVHRYGGWSLHKGPVPSHLIYRLLTDGLDFCTDYDADMAFYKAVALGSRDSIIPLFSNYISREIPQKRLARGLGAKSRTGEPPLSNKQYSLLLALRLGLPGLCFLTPEDLMGAFPSTTAIQAKGQQGLMALENAVTSLGARSPDSMPGVAHHLKLRHDFGLARATLERVNSVSKDCVVFVSALPEHGYWLTVANVGQTQQDCVVRLPVACKNGTIYDATNNIRIPCADKSLHLQLGPSEFRYLVLNK